MDRTADIRRQWPDRVLIIGWAAELRREDRHLENPMSCIMGLQAEAAFVNLVTLMPRDPAVHLQLGCNKWWVLR